MVHKGQNYRFDFGRIHPPPQKRNRIMFLKEQSNVEKAQKYDVLIESLLTGERKSKPIGKIVDFSC